MARLSGEEVRAAAQLLKSLKLLICVRNGDREISDISDFSEGPNVRKMEATSHFAIPGEFDLGI